MTTVGDEVAGAHDVEQIWSRAVGVYRSGVHPAIQLCIRHAGKCVLDRSIGQARGVVPGRPLTDARVVPLSTRTPMNIFSASKAITATAMHVLDEQGAVSLDAPVPHRHDPPIVRMCRRAHMNAAPSRHLTFA